MDKLNGNRVDMTKEVRSMEEMGTAMGRLREVCKANKIPLKVITTEQIYSVYYDRDINIVFVHTNASDANINLFMEYLMKG